MNEKTSIHGFDIGEIVEAALDICESVWGGNTLHTKGSILRVVGASHNTLHPISVVAINEPQFSFAVSVGEIKALSDNSINKMVFELDTQQQKINNSLLQVRGRAARCGLVPIYPLYASDLNAIRKLILTQSPEIQVLVDTHLHNQWAKDRKLKFRHEQDAKDWCMALLKARNKIPSED